MVGYRSVWRSLIGLLMERTNGINTWTQECVESLIYLLAERTDGRTQECVEYLIYLLAERTDGRTQECGVSDISAGRED